MPLTRYQIRSHYALADPELYRSSDKDDPDSVLESVAMAGLVGILRQLGDLAQFAAEIFHDLHEEVMVTAARGHGLMVRVQQLEAEFPTIEKAILSQTNHSSFFSNGGVDWHPNLHTEQNLITRGDLPRFVMDSYEECRGPPRLFLLDKYDVAGAGACLTRYTDPSFFRVEAPFTGLENMEIQREKKIRKVKKKGSRWRNGETPEIRPTSHAKLHQLLMEERVQNNLSDPARIVRLKKRQFNDPPFESETGRSYMEKFVQDSSPENRVVHNASARSLHSEFTSDNTSDSGVDVVDIGTVSPPKRQSPEKRSTYLAADLQEVSEKSISNEEVIDDDSLKVSGKSFSGDRIDNHSALQDMISEKDLAVDTEHKAKNNIDDYHSDDATSEIDDYMDALPTMEADMDTDNEYRTNKAVDSLKPETCGADSDANDEQLDPQVHYSDTHSLETFSASDDGNSSSKRERSSVSHSDTVSSLAENTLSDSDRAGKIFPSERFVVDTVDMPPHQYTASAEVSEVESRDIATNSVCIDEGEICDAGGASTDPNDVFLENTITEEDKIHVTATSGACVVDPAVVPHPPDSEVTPCSGEKPSDDIDRINVPKTDEYMASLGDSSVVSSNPFHSKHNALSPEPSESCAVDELCESDKMISSDVMHSSDILNQHPEKTESDNEVIQTELESEPIAEKLSSEKVESELSTLTAPEETFHPLNTEFEMSPKAEAKLESSTSMAAVPNSEGTPPDEDQHLIRLESDGMSSLENRETLVPLVEANQLELSLSDVEPARIEGLDLELQDGGVCNQSGSEENFNTELVADGAITSASSPPRNLDSKPDYPDDICSLENCQNDELQPAYHNSDPANSLAQPSELPTERIDLGCISEDISNSKSSNLQNEESQSADSVNQEACLVTSLEPCSEQPESVRSPIDDTCPRSGLIPMGKEANYEYSAEDLPSQPLPVENGPQSDSTELCVTELLDASHSVGPNSALQLQETSQISFASEKLSSSELLLLSAANERGMKQSVDQPSYIYPDFDSLQRETQPSLASSKSSVEDIVNNSAPSDSLQQVFVQEYDHSEQAMHSLRSDFPLFGFPPLAPQVTLEEMPPLPPLPPMQWRLGKVHNTPSASQKDLFGQSHAALPSIQAPFGKEHQFGFPSSDKGILHPQNPFLSQTETEDEKYQHVSEPSDKLFDDGHGQRACFGPEATDSTNPFSDNYSIVSDPTLPLPTANDSALSSEKLEEKTSSVDQTVQNHLVIQQEQETQPDISVQQPNTEESQLHYVLSTGKPGGTSSEDQPAQKTQRNSQEEENQQDLSVEQAIDESQSLKGLQSFEGEVIQPENSSCVLPVNEDEKPKKLARPRSPLIDAVAAHDRSMLRKVTERSRPQAEPKEEERNSLLEQIRTKSFNLKPAAVNRPIIQGPKTNLKVAAILEKANKIRQAWAGSDEDDSDGWSDT